MTTQRMTGLVFVLGLLAILTPVTGAALAENGYQAELGYRVFSMLDDLVIPEEWAGIWETEITVYDCDSGFQLFSSTELDTMCTGGVPVDSGDEDIEITCSGTIDADSFDIQCSGSAVVEPDCTAEVEWTAVGTRNGDAMSSTITITTTTVGSGCEGGEATFCLRNETIGNRIAPEPEDCALVAAEELSWSTIKGLYR